MSPLNQVADGVKGLTDVDMHSRRHATLNTIAWDAWHTFRAVDNLVHFVCEREDPVRSQQDLWKKWNRPKVDQGTARCPRKRGQRSSGPGLIRLDTRPVIDAVLPRMVAMYSRLHD